MEVLIFSFLAVSLAYLPALACLFQAFWQCICQMSQAISDSPLLIDVWVCSHPCASVNWIQIEMLCFFTFVRFTQHRKKGLQRNQRSAWMELLWSVNTGHCWIPKFKLFCITFVQKHSSVFKAQVNLRWTERQCLRCFEKYRIWALLYVPEDNKDHPDVISKRHAGASASTASQTRFSYKMG